MNSFRYFFQSTRPKTLPASIIPVMMASALAYIAGKFNPFIGLLVLICAMLIQIITNYINEIYDFKRGVDTSDRVGPRRSVAAGLISVRAMRNTSLGLIIITFILGLELTNYSNVNILFVGIFSILFAYLYTGGPYPIAYSGFSDIFVFLFFGVIAVCGTYYIFTQNLTSVVFLSSFAPGLFSMNILGVNNYRDIETDKKAGKKTLAIIIGPYFSKLLYVTSNFISYLSLLLIYFEVKSNWLLLPFLTLPYNIILCKNIYIKTGKDLNNVLAGTGKLLLIYGFLFSIGILIYGGK
jgi:1,4-dihydroxy-2-naphthoate octaprenyltransferase